MHFVHISCNYCAIISFSSHFIIFILLDNFNLIFINLLDFINFGRIIILFAAIYLIFNQFVYFYLILIIYY